MQCFINECKCFGLSHVSACFLYCCAALYGVTVFSLCCFLLWIVLHLLYCVAVLCCVVLCAVIY